MELETIEVEINGVKTKVVVHDIIVKAIKEINDEHAVALKTAKGEGAKETRISYEEKLKAKDTEILEKDTKIKELEPLQSELEKATTTNKKMEKTIAAFNLFGGKVSMDTLSDLLDLPKYADIDITTEEGQQQFTEKFKEKFGKLIGDDANANAGEGKGGEKPPRTFGGNGGGSEGDNKIITSSTDPALKGKSKAEINQILDKLKEESK